MKYDVCTKERKFEVDGVAYVYFEYGVRFADELGRTLALVPLRLYH